VYIPRLVPVMRTVVAEDMAGLVERVIGKNRTLSWMQDEEY
jgi:hypothetical protein